MSSDEKESVPEKRQSLVSFPILQFVFCFGEDGCPEIFNGDCNILLATLLNNLKKEAKSDRSFVILDNSMRSLYTMTLADIVTQHNVGTLENYLYLAQQQPQSLMAPSSSCSSSSASSSFRNVQKSGSRNSTRRDLQEDDGGQATLTGAGRSRLLARCRTHCLKP